ncbi:hypothetical protein UCDDA912_g02647 [Diaporthe ampelina]|uniref:Uncharacterized protein n=1 Tax=Diaporthe ampelina TaxID=1214573 RepID=A0A0G2FT06_9PEZI|nr:hypothetical protein UCDDA912_g02647 [Diaporthe ampelina]
MPTPIATLAPRSPCPPLSLALLRSSDEPARENDCRPGPLYWLAPDPSFTSPARCTLTVISCDTMIPPNEDACCGGPLTSCGAGDGDGSGPGVWGGGGGDMGGCSSSIAYAGGASPCSTASDAESTDPTPGLVSPPLLGLPFHSFSVELDSPDSAPHDDDRCSIVGIGTPSPSTAPPRSPPDVCGRPLLNSRLAILASRSDARLECDVAAPAALPALVAAPAGTALMMGASSRCTDRVNARWFGESLYTSWCTLNMLSGTNSHLGLSTFMWIGTTILNEITVQVPGDEPADTGRHGTSTVLEHSTASSKMPSSTHPRSDSMLSVSCDANIISLCEMFFSPAIRLEM